MIKKTIIFILLCIPILSGCTCNKYHNKVVKPKHVPCYKHELLVTPYLGPLSSIDYPKESLGHHHKHEGKKHAIIMNSKNNKSTKIHIKDKASGLVNKTEDDINVMHNKEKSLLIETGNKGTTEHLQDTTGGLVNKTEDDINVMHNKEKSLLIETGNKGTTEHLQDTTGGLVNKIKDDINVMHNKEKATAVLIETAPPS